MPGVTLLRFTLFRPGVGGMVPQGRPYFGWEDSKVVPGM
jgi:hypothetical protein